MICPECQSINIKKHGLKRGKQNHICSDYDGQFIDVYLERGYSQEVKKPCLHLYLEGNGSRRRERVTGVSNNTVINWVKKLRNSLSTSPDYYEIPERAWIDELQTYVAKKQQNMAVDNCK
jgi:transposase-like protein